jgi:hypothetical protein
MLFVPQLWANSKDTRKQFAYVKLWRTEMRPEELRTHAGKATRAERELTEFGMVKYRDFLRAP